jgi:hypothetical protein
MVLTNNILIDVAGLKGVYELIKKTCEAHIAISQHKVGYDLTTDNSDKQYPLSYLESNIGSQIDGSLETFQIALSIADRLPNDYSSDDLVNVKSKIDQILSEIHYRLENVATNVGISGLDKLHYDDVNEDVLAVIRGEISVTIPRYTARDGATLVIPEYGSNDGVSKYSVFAELEADIAEIVEHNLNSNMIIVNFYNEFNERIECNYSIIDNNRIQVESAVSTTVLIVIIASEILHKVNLTAGVEHTLTHSLGTDRILVQFYTAAGENISVDYRIADLDTITILSQIDITGLSVVIFK